MILLPGDERNPPSDEKPIYTRSGWEIPQEHPPRLAPGKMLINANELQGWHPNIKLRSLSNYPYNCVGMIFASRRAWIEIEHIDDILSRDGYRSIPRSEAMAGDVVLYKNDKGEPTHVALIVFFEPVSREVAHIQVISKWGRDAEFLHFAEDVVVQLGTPVEFYTDRVGP